MTDTATRILDIAERQMRQHGYNAVSYRDIAAEMGIKSASLHYHFPKKADLGISLVKRVIKLKSSLICIVEPSWNKTLYVSAPY